MLAFALITQAMAYETTGVLWPAGSFPLSYTVDQSLGTKLPAEDTLAAIQAGFSTWGDLDCAELGFEYKGMSQGSWGVADGLNTVYLIGEDWPGDPKTLSMPWILTRGDEVVEVDIALNAQHFDWALEGADGQLVFDVQAAVTHEVGHLLGLWHATDDDVTLHPALAGHPDARTLSADDAIGACEINSETSPTLAELGEVCEEDADCADGVCIEDGTLRYCSVSCESGSDCPEGWDCFDLGEESFCGMEEESSGGCAVPPAAGLWSVLTALGLGLLRSRETASQG